MNDSFDKTDYLTVVNKDNPVDKDWINCIELSSIENIEGQRVLIESRTKKAYLELKSKMFKLGIVVGVDSAYRSVAEQEEIMQDFIKNEGKEYALKYVAKPGTSEHHTGLCVDVIPKVNGEWVTEHVDLFNQTEIFKKMHKLLPECGLILRYPVGKEFITGYSYEPWHVRYVGKRVAGMIFVKKTTLEEFCIEMS